MERTPWRILLNFLLGAIIIFGWPPLIWAHDLFDPSFDGHNDGELWSDLLSYMATFENQSLAVVLVAIFIYALFASTVIFIIKGMLLQWYTSAAELHEVRGGLQSIIRLPLRILEHFILWVSIALTWIALGVCYETIKPNQVFGFNELWEHYSGVWNMLGSENRLYWQISLLAAIAVPSALSDLYLNRRFIKRVKSIVEMRGNLENDIGAQKKYA